MSLIFSALFQILLKYCNRWIDELAEPNPKHTPDRLKREIAHKRNRFLIFVQLAILLLFLIDTTVNKAQISVNMVRLLTTAVVLTSLKLSNKYNPHIFNFLYNIICLMYGPTTMDQGEEGLYVSYLSTFYLPSFVYVFTGSLGHALFQTGIQMIYANTIFRVRMKNAMAFMDPEHFEKNLIKATNSAFGFHIILIFFSCYLMQHIHKTVSTTQKKNDEAENQKTFLLGFSHELRNLINSLTGNVKLASFETLTPKAKELLLNAEVCGELLLHLVNNILDTGKVEIGELEINPVSTRIYDTLERIWGVCSELIKRKNLTGKLTIPKDLPRNIMIDHYRLTQIFLNLVGNAVKFTERGSIDVRVHWIEEIDRIDECCFIPYPFNTSDDYDEGLFEKSNSMTHLDQNVINLDLSSRKVNQSLLRPPNDTQKGVLKISITDTGCGMSQNEIEKLFQKFSQVTSDASKRKLGTGLGLFITKQLSQRMQGEIRVFSRKEHGTCFMFCIPTDVVQKESEHLHDLESIKKLVRSQKLNAMIVDDVIFNHSVLKSFFHSLGIEVVDFANNGREAYRKYSQHLETGYRPHIITMDLEMPIMDGKEAARKIRHLEKEKRLEPCCLIIVSGNCTESEIAECMDEHGQIRANAFIKKPATIEEILRVATQHFVYP